MEKVLSKKPKAKLDFTDHSVVITIPPGHPANMDPENQEVQIKIWMPNGGGYLRFDNKQNNQVCTNLMARGKTLSARDSDDFKQIVRNAWRGYQRRMFGV